MLANTILEKRYSEWLSDKSISPGMKLNNIILSVVFALVIIIFSTIHYSFPNFMDVMKDFPTHPDIRLKSIAGVESAFDYAVIKGDRIFDAITFGIRSVLDSLELLFVKTPCFARQSLTSLRLVPSLKPKNSKSISILKAFAF